MQMSRRNNNNNNNNNNSLENVYGAIVMTKVIGRVHQVYLMNVDWAPGGRQPSDQAIDLGCESAENCQLPSTSTIATVIITQPVSWYSFYHPTEGGKLSRPRHCTALHIAAAVMINTTGRGVIRTLVLSHRSQTATCLSVCDDRCLLLVTTVGPAKTAEPIEMPLGGKRRLA